ncbi:MAG: response regulator [Dongiaceae bacterium]
MEEARARGDRPPDAALERPPMKDPDLAAIKVLLVDDDEHMLLLLNTMLNRLGMRDVRRSAGVAEAIKELQHAPADVVITDLHMSPLSGIDLVREIRQGDSLGWRDIRILMITGQPDLRHVEEAVRGGIDDFLVKPISPETLYARIVAVLKRREPRQSTEGGDRREPIPTA